MKQHYRSILISDLHLGSKGCQAEKLLAFLKTHTADNLYLVGDIIDLWALSRKIYFPQSHLKVLKKVLALSKNTRIVYVRGNHDETLDEFVPFNIGNIEVVMEAEHVTADGRKLLICHGDKYDQVMQYARWLAVLGDIGYTLLLKSNAYVNWFRRKFGRGYWSLYAYAKRRVKKLVGFIGDFENAVAKDAAANGYDGVVCGHIHHCEMKKIQGIDYYNDGDWVESCTALIEDELGNIRIIDFLVDPSPNYDTYTGYIHPE